MKLVCISDTHGSHDQLSGVYALPKGDVLIHAGDCTRTGTLAELEEFNTWLGTLPYKHKLLVAGNHDWCFAHQPAQALERLTNCSYLQDSGCEIAGVKFWGSPWCAGGGASRGVFVDYPAALPPPPLNTDVLITHHGSAPCLDFESVLSTPPKGVSMSSWIINSPPVRSTRPYKFKLHVYGHCSSDSSSAGATLSAYVSVAGSQHFDEVVVGEFPHVFRLEGTAIKPCKTLLQKRYHAHVVEKTHEAHSLMYNRLFGERQKLVWPAHNEMEWLDGKVLRTTPKGVLCLFYNFTHPQTAPYKRLCKPTLFAASVRAGQRFSLRSFRTAPDVYTLATRIDRSATVHTIQCGNVA